MGISCSHWVVWPTFISEPYDLRRCPQVVVLCQGNHSHPPPSPIKTPAPLHDLLQSILLELGWKLADATPRKILLDSGFMNTLKRVLAWDSSFDPSLADLHPSLGNADHLQRYISVLHLAQFPSGTDFKGETSTISIPTMHTHVLHTRRTSYRYNYPG